MELSKYSAAEALSMAIIWDGAMGTLLPLERCLAWRGGPRWWRDTVDWFVSHPRLTRSLGLTELGVGVWLAARTRKAAPLFIEPMADSHRRGG